MPCDGFLPVQRVGSAEKDCRIKNATRRGDWVGGGWAISVEFLG